MYGVNIDQVSIMVAEGFTMVEIAENQNCSVPYLRKTVAAITGMSWKAFKEIPFIYQYRQKMIEEGKLSPEYEFRPLRRYEIDFKKVESLLEGGMMPPEVCRHLGMSRSIVDRECQIRFGKTLQEYRNDHYELGNGKLHVRQYQKAMSGDNTMLMWVGKFRLGQNDKADKKAEFDGSLAQLLEGFHKLGNLRDGDNGPKSEAD